MQGLRTSKRYHITREVIAVPNTNKTQLNKLDYVCYYNEEGLLTSISKHQITNNKLSMKNIRPNQHGFKSALKACFNSKPCNNCIG